MESVAILSPQLYESLQTYRRNQQAKISKNVLMPMQFGNLKRTREERMLRKEKRIRTQRPSRGVIVMNIPDSKFVSGGMMKEKPRPQIFAASGAELKEGASAAMMLGIAQNNCPVLPSTTPKNKKYEPLSLQNKNNVQSSSFESSTTLSLEREDSLTSDPGFDSLTSEPGFGGEDDIDLLFDDSVNAFEHSSMLMNDEFSKSGAPIADTTTRC